MQTAKIRSGWYEFGQFCLSFWKTLMLMNPTSICAILRECEKFHPSNYNLQPLDFLMFNSRLICLMLKDARGCQLNIGSMDTNTGQMRHDTNMDTRRHLKYIIRVWQVRLWSIFLFLRIAALHNRKNTLNVQTSQVYLLGYWFNGWFDLTE